MLAERPLRPREPRESSTPTRWDRARLGAVLPLCVVVVIAIGCIIIAALTSAKRADEVALEREKHLFVKAIVNRSDWSLRKLKAVLPMDASMRGLDTAHLQARLSAWQTTLMDHDILAVADAPDQISYSQAVDSVALPRWTTGQIPELRPLSNICKAAPGRCRRASCA